MAATIFMIDTVQRDRDIKIDYEKVFHTAPAFFLLLKPNSPIFTILDASDLFLNANNFRRDQIAGKGLFEIFPGSPYDLKVNGVSNLMYSLNKVVKSKEANAMPLQKYNVHAGPENNRRLEEKYLQPVNLPVFDDKREIMYIMHQVNDATSMVLRESKQEKDLESAAAELQKKSVWIEENSIRINRILDALLKYTVMDFSDRLNVSQSGDELDAIIIGLNSVIDELENHIHLLTKSNAELEYSNNELDAFSYSVSHDLRAPLRAINGFSEVLLEDYGDKLDDEGKKLVKIIVRNAYKMGSLIDDLLTFSRVGKQSLTKIILNMNNIVNSTIKDIPATHAAGLLFNVSSLENIYGDNSMLRLVFNNLISNAVKYSSKKEKPQIEVGCYEKDNMMTYFIKDNGAGFDMKYYGKLFGVFQRLHSNAEFEGTGVGLALVQRIIKKHHGEVWATSEPGQGATFFFSLPVQ